MRRGFHLPPEKRQRVIELLRIPDLQISAIAERLGLTRSYIASINRVERIRDYDGHHNKWRFFDKQT